MSPLLWLCSVEGEWELGGGTLDKREETAMGSAELRTGGLVVVFLIFWQCNSCFSHCCEKYRPKLRRKTAWAQSEGTGAGASGSSEEAEANTGISRLYLFYSVQDPAHGMVPATSVNLDNPSQTSRALSLQWCYILWCSLLNCTGPTEQSRLCKLTV